MGYLEIKHTCPDIDKALRQFKHLLEDAAAEVENYMEDVRSTNSALRDDAEAKLEEAEDRVAEISRELDDAYAKIEELESEINYLNEELAKLQA